nr:Slam-dependent surface lipoprotein [uncultured Moellerella sp.]
MRKLNYFILISSIGLVSTAQAEVGFNKSDDVTGQTRTINVGPSQLNIPAHPAPVGSPGIGISSIARGMKIGFKGLLGTEANPTPQDAHGTYDTSSTSGQNHPRNNGFLRFQKVADEEVYFGEWKYEQDTTAYRNVYYAGENITTNMPTSGSATYSTTVISGNYGQNGPTTGDLVANFETNKLEGNLANHLFTLNIDANIQPVTASFDGNAKIVISGNEDIAGKTDGHFFNDQASSLAGIATFENNSHYDSAFAGKKQD